MRCLALLLAASAGLVAASVWPTTSLAQHERDYINTDDEGHLIFRYAGSESPDADETQMEEIFNAFVSVMVHDRLRADILFDAEPVDAPWADWLESEIDSHLVPKLPKHSSVDLQCRSATCRLILQQTGQWTVTNHRATMDEVQRVVQDFIGSGAMSMDPVFLMTAYYQQTETPHVKLFLKRTQAELSP